MIDYLWTECGLNTNMWLFMDRMRSEYNFVIIYGQNAVWIQICDYLWTEWGLNTNMWLFMDRMRSEYKYVIIYGQNAVWIQICDYLWTGWGLNTNMWLFMDRMRSEYKYVIKCVQKTEYCYSTVHDTIKLYLKKSVFYFIVSLYGASAFGLFSLFVVRFFCAIEYKYWNL